MSSSTKSNTSSEINVQIDRKLGVFIEHMNDQFERVLEANQGQAEKIMGELQNVSDRLGYIEQTTSSTNLKLMSVEHEVSTLKVRSDRDVDEFDSLKREVKSNTEKIRKFKTA